jgi:hypothetical protein
LSFSGSLAGRISALAIVHLNALSLGRGSLYLATVVDGMKCSTLWINLKSINIDQTSLMAGFYHSFYARNKTK